MDHITEPKIELPGKSVKTSSEKDAASVTMTPEGE